MKKILLLFLFFTIDLSCKSVYDTVINATCPSDGPHKWSKDSNINGICNNYLTTIMGTHSSGYYSDGSKCINANQIECHFTYNR